MRDIGKNIRDLRVRNGLTQEEMAGRLFVTRQTVSNYEIGKTRPDVDTILRIADLFHTDANTVFYGLPIPESKKVARKRLLISSTLLLVFVLLSAVLHPRCSALQTNQYLVAPSLLLNLLLDAPLLLLLGWWIMNGIGYLLKISPLQKPWAKKLKFAIQALLCAGIVLLLPYVIWLFVGLIEYAMTGAAQTGFPQLPGYQAIVQLLLIINRRYSAIYALLGGLLWLVGAPKQVDLEQSL